MLGLHTADVEKLIHVLHRLVRGDHARRPCAIGHAYGGGTRERFGAVIANPGTKPNLQAHVYVVDCQVKPDYARPLPKNKSSTLLTQPKDAHIVVPPSVRQ